MYDHRHFDWHGRPIEQRWFIFPLFHSVKGCRYKQGFSGYDFHLYDIPVFVNHTVNYNVTGGLQTRVQAQTIAS
jgi:hypothetical protein